MVVVFVFGRSAAAVTNLLQLCVVMEVGMGTKVRWREIDDDDDVINMSTIDGGGGGFLCQKTPPPPVAQSFSFFTSLSGFVVHV